MADRWNIGCKLEPRRNGQTVLRINASQANRFLALVAPFVPACMAYKLAERRLISAPVPGFTLDYCRGSDYRIAPCGAPLHLVVHAGFTLAPCCPSLGVQVHQKGFYTGWMYVQAAAASV